MPDPTFPALHVRPAHGWLNDPNGLARIDGVWHVFFQHNPREPVHRDVAWGHVSSTDLLVWREHPVALAPRPGQLDAAGCWSGCLVVEDGVPTAVYTAVRNGPEDGVATLARSQGSQTSQGSQASQGSRDSLDHWTQDDRPVAGIPVDQGAEQVRDPFLLEVDGRRYAVQGSGGLVGPAAILAYDATDLTDWRPLGPLLTIEDPIAAEVAAAHIWECPSLVRVDGRWVLLVSRWRWTGETHDLAGCAWLVGELEVEPDGLRFRPETGGRLDDGPAFYAPQALALPEGRVLLWGWSWELDRTEDDVRRAGWAGTLTHPRDLHVVDGVLRVTPATELAGLRAEGLDPGAPIAVGDVPAFEAHGSGPLTLTLVDGPRDQVVYAHDGVGDVTLLVDGSIVETFHDGSTYTTRAYPTPTSHWLLHGADRVWALRLP